MILKIDGRVSETQYGCREAALIWQRPTFNEFLSSLEPTMALALLAVFSAALAPAALNPRQHTSAVLLRQPLAAAKLRVLGGAGHTYHDALHAVVAPWA